jgi:hypothetical protein
VRREGEAEGGCKWTAALGNGHSAAVGRLACWASLPACWVLQLLGWGAGQAERADAVDPTAVMRCRYAYKSIYDASRVSGVSVHFGIADKGAVAGDGNPGCARW